MKPMGEELRSHGLEVTGGTDEEKQYEGDYFTYEQIQKYPFDDDVGAVITGIDFKVDYSKLALASMYIQRGAKWIVTNEDAFTMQHGYRAPGNGMLIAALESGLKRPDGEGLICDKINTGKPNKAIIDLIRGQHDIPESELSKFVMIGDRPDTDIALGNNSGIASCLVLSGVVTKESEIAEYVNHNRNFTPTHVIDSFG